MKKVTKLNRRHYQQSELIEEISLVLEVMHLAAETYRPASRRFSIILHKRSLVAFHGRAAYERVIFEKFENAMLSENCHPSQNLLMPESLELDAIDSKRLLDDMQELAKIGFQIEESVEIIFVFKAVRSG